MTRQKLAIVFAGALAVLYGYMILGSFTSDNKADPLHFLGLGLAVGLLFIEVGLSKKG